MTVHEKFMYRSLDEIRADIDKFGIELPILDDLGPLKSPISMKGTTIPNSIGIHPMEGCDGTDRVAPAISPSGDMRDLPGRGRIIVV